MEGSEVDVFGFTTLRSPAEMRSPLTRRGLFQDDFLMSEGQPNGPADDFSPRLAAAFAAAQPGLNPVELFSQNSVSPVARLAVAAVHSELTSASNATTNSRQRNVRVISRLSSPLLSMLAQGLPYGAGATPYRTAPVLKALPINSTLSAQDSALLTRSTSAGTFTLGNVLYRSPVKVDGLPLPFAPSLLRLYDVMNALMNSSILEKNPSAVRQEVGSAARSAFNINSEAQLIDQVLSFDGAGLYGHFLFSKRVAFDCYYAFYLLRRNLPIDLAPALAALRALNVLEQVAAEEFLLNLDGVATPTNNQTQRLALLKAAYPQLSKWRPGTSSGLKALAAIDAPGIRSLAQLREALSASPVIHPFFARLTAMYVPFNDIRPIGLGDMKVVRQKFKGYEKSEIAHIETVLAGEEKTRTHRHMDKSETSFSFATTSDTSYTKDIQSTSRFELKAEAERAIQLTVGVNANTQFNFKGGFVLDTASLGAGLSVNTSDNKTERASQNFAREVVQRATESIQTKVSSQRAQTLSTESEETNVHKFINTTSTPTNGNISGIYLWLDKVYEGQVYALGQRLMFEFVVPEPAAFYVDMRLQAYARKVQLPREPTRSDAQTSGPTLPIRSPSEITVDKFRELTASYELSRFKFPEETISKLVLNPAPQGPSVTPGPNFQMQRPSFFADTTPSRDEAFSGDIGEVPPGFAIDAFTVTGTATFIAPGDSNPDEINTIQVFVSNQMVFSRVDETSREWTNVGAGSGVRAINVRALNMGATSPLPIRIVSKTCTGHILNFRVTLRRTPQGLLAWQQQVYDEITRQEGSKSAGNSGAQEYESKLAQYNDAIDKLSAVELNDIIRGTSPRSNDALVRTELKRQCIEEIAREFDADASDDVVSRLDAVSNVPLVNAIYRRLEVKSSAQPPSQYAEFADKPDIPGTRYVADNLVVSRRKARYIQFLEQAFDWNQLSYLFYPYFWAAMPRWIEMLDREDDADPLFTEFLRAGSARVLLSVKPGYEDSVLHFIATGEPWDGGAPPVIGDPTFIPLYEEIRAQQTRDTAGTPVGDSWLFRMPTSLVYLESTNYPLVNEFKPNPPTP